ncbi:MAG: glycosyltransferase, partial [Candidatus Methanomethylicaceae archaeon]
MKQDKQAKIAVVVHSLKPGGAEIMACRLAISLSHHYRCIIVALDTDGPLSTELMGHKVPYVALNRKRGFDLQLVNNLARIFQSENVSLIHAHQYTPFAYSLLARSRGSFVPVVFTEHGRFLPDRRRLRRLFFNRLVPRSEDKMTAVGESI